MPARSNQSINHDRYSLLNAPGALQVGHCPTAITSPLPKERTFFIISRTCSALAMFSMLRIEVAYVASGRVVCAATYFSRHFWQKT